MLSLREKVGQLMFVGFAGLEPPDYVLDWLAEGRIGGVYLFSRNIASPEQVAALTQACHQAAVHPILIGIDQEGGLVARFREGFTESPGGMALSASDNPELARAMSEVLAIEMRALGINWVFAPVVDVVHDINNASVSTRSIGVDVNRVAEFAVAQIEGFQAHVAATAKHFPGLGKSPIDTHLELAVIDDSVDYIREHDLIPFKAAVDAGVASVMTTHTKFMTLDDEHPATLSPIVLKQLLRDELDYNGLVATDCLEMGAITNHYGPAESAILSVLAGVDTVMFSHTREYQEQAFDAVLNAVESGRIPEAVIDAAVDRIMAVKQRYAITQAPDLAQIRAPQHLEVAQEAARAGTVLVRGDDALFPLPDDDNIQIGLIEFASYLDSEVMERTGQTGFANLLRQRLPDLVSVALRTGAAPETLQEAQQLAAESDIVILVTRSMHLIPAHREMAELIYPKAKRLILVCLRNPYDVELVPEADVMLCTCGDAAPSMQAAVDALLGDFTPQGNLPVPVRV